jgi:hypothetical protein
MKEASQTRDMILLKLYRMRKRTKRRVKRMMGLELRFSKVKIRYLFQNQKALLE